MLPIRTEGVPISELDYNFEMFYNTSALLMFFNNPLATPILDPFVYNRRTGDVADYVLYMRDLIYYASNQVSVSDGGEFED